MSFTAPWLSPDPNETILYSNHEPTDWIFLSPTPDQSTHSLQDITHTQRSNSGHEPGSHQSPAYTLENQPSHGHASPSNLLRKHFTPTFSRILRGDSFARLPALKYTPSPTLPELAYPDFSDVGSQDLSSVSLLSPLLFGSSSFSGSQESYELKASPLSGLLYSGCRSTLDSFQSDASPVIRCSQSQEPAKDIPPPKSRRKHKPKNDQQARLTFVDQLASLPQNTPADTSTPLEHISSGYTSPLRSPCKLASIRRDGRPTRSVAAPRDLKEIVSLAKPADPKTTSFRRQTAAPVSLASSGPASSSQYDHSKPRNLKRPREEEENQAPPAKLSRCDSELSKSSRATASQASGSTDAQDPGQFTFSNRILPPSVELSSRFPLFYRRFPASSYFRPDPESSPCSLFNVSHPGGTYNPPRSAFDLYTPRFVKGKGIDKVGMCPICIESVERGGLGKKVWLPMKTSAFKCYHMQYYHGISAANGRPFSPPLAFKVVRRKNFAKTERAELCHGKCHKCSKWVPVEGIKDVECKVPEIYWWKHAATCHKQTTIPGERCAWEEDTVYKRLQELNKGK